MNYLNNTIKLLKENDVVEAKTQYNLHLHSDDITTTARINFLNIIFNNYDKYYIKISILEENKWQFISFGWLLINENIVLYIELNKKKIIIRTNNTMSVRKHKHIILTTLNEGSFLLTCINDVVAKEISNILSIYECSKTY